jgi:hypothetical protein
VNRMSGTTTTAATRNDGSLGPQPAAALQGQAIGPGRRTSGPAHPLLWTYRAAFALVAFGGFWLSVRSHHNPYSAPGGWSLTVAFALAAVNIAWSTVVLRRAGAGVTGPAQRRKRAWAGLMLAAWIAAYSFTTPLYHAASGPHPVWGLYPASAPLLFIGLLGAITAAALREWRMAGITLAVALVAVAAGLGGPAGAWLITGIGLSALMLGAAAQAAGQQHRGPARP